MVVADTDGGSVMIEKPTWNRTTDHSDEALNRELLRMRGVVADLEKWGDALAEELAKVQRERAWVYSWLAGYEE